jgi:hypothetical protein
MKYISLIILLWPGWAPAIEWNDEDCGPWNAHEGKVFSLDIGTSFHGKVTFKLCKSKEQNTLSITKTSMKFDEETEKSTETIVHEHIKISKKDYQSIYRSYEKALNYNTLDDASGLDGSSWCIESQRGFTYTKACFWTPSYKPKSRGLNGLYELGSQLWKFSGLEKSNEFKLY